MKIVALDFETADNGPDSACALAMVAIEGGTISGQKSFLIRPPRDTFRFTYIHGITWAHVRNELIFAERIPEIEDFIRNASYLVAHYAPFDRRVLYNCYSVSGHNPPAYPFSCTVRLARAAWQIYPTKLPDVCSHLGIALNHHDAQSDALACARIAIAAQEAGVPIEMGLVGAPTYTTFNKSKRITKEGKQCWPSTLTTTGYSMTELVAQMGEDNASVLAQHIPVIGYAQAGDKGYFDDAGYPTGSDWDEVLFPQIGDLHAFALEISGDSMEPIYRDGDTIIVSPGAEIRRGDRVVVRIRDGEVMAKELTRQSARKVELVSLNEAHPDRTLDIGEIDWISRIVWASQ